MNTESPSNIHPWTYESFLLGLLEWGIREKGPLIVGNPHMSHSLNSLNRVIWGILLGGTIGAIKVDTRNLDSGSYGASGWGLPAGLQELLAART